MCPVSIRGTANINYNDILPYVEKGLVSDQGHFLDPDVRILNYTQKCQFSRHGIRSLSSVED